MSRTRRWKDAPGTTGLEFEVDFTSTGYYDPGKRIGDPDRCYPPEGEDERTVTEIRLGGKVMPPELFQCFVKVFDEQIMEAVNAAELEEKR